MAPPGGSTANPGVSGVPPRKAAYSAADFGASGVKVADEVRELFDYIARYKPHNVELDTKLKCFIPDYIPAVGEIDPFLKVRGPGATPPRAACVSAVPALLLLLQPRLPARRVRSRCRRTGARTTWA